MPAAYRLAKSAQVWRPAGKTKPSCRRALATSFETHPLARKPALGRINDPSSPKKSVQQKWSTATALTLATLTGASVITDRACVSCTLFDAPGFQTYILGTLSSPSAIEGKVTQKSADRPMQPTMADFDIAFSQVKAILPQECITQEREDLISHGRSSWTYHDPKVLPGAVLYPRHTEDVRLCLGKISYTNSKLSSRLSRSWRYANFDS